MSYQQHGAIPGGAYPLAEVERPNKAYARLMLENMAGGISEMTAVATYFYNRLVTYGREDISIVFQKISIEEMHHLEIFGRLAMQLGENPKLAFYNRNQRTAWNASFCRYTLDFKSLIENAIESEKETIRRYEMQASRIDDKLIVANLNRITVDEKRHLEVFTLLLERNYGTKK